ncbi:Ribokinase [Dermatophilus congolensis]|uniref:Ribokinase n=1 Tax=Dermatophilus congolensis TaxID=1863 RepID=A0AA46BLA3_9MICO|nr:ribokinase [Dermatophilus congolensis]STD03649.1 Ribokinase [Dermatophilus congolensis]
MTNNHENTSHSRVVVFGSLNADLYARVERHPTPGETVLGTGGFSRPGGKGANQAVAAALAGASVTMVGAIGEDANAEVALSLLNKAGVDCTGVRVVPGPTGTAIIAVSAQGENLIIVIPGANGKVTPDYVPAIRDTDVLVLQGEIPVESIDAAAAAAVAAGARPVINLAPIVDVAPATLLAANPLVVNEHEALAAADIVDPQRAGAVLADDVHEMAENVADRLLQAGVESVVITLGGQGALVASAEGKEHVPGEMVEVVDTTGAGDCFVGVVAAGLATGLSLAEAATAANSAAARAVGAEGTQHSYPGWEELA